ncbi:hypothetical protein OSTOST_02865, partial [Ostertagia ostertagi]
FQYSGWESECVPAPFVAQSSLGCAVVLKPTRGDFLHYNMGDDLHIGISNSVSVVHSYWVNGISSECVGWDKSIVVCRFSDDEDRFDFLLSSFLRETANNFEQEFYDDARWNCFDFVMEFLRFINFRRYTKIDFVSEFVQGALNSAIKYNTLVHRVQERGLVPKIRSSFEEVEESERAAQQRLENLLFEAEVMLREYEHLKQGIRV